MTSQPGRALCRFALDVLLPARCRHCNRVLRMEGPLCLSCFRLLTQCAIPDSELPGCTPGGRAVWAASYYRQGSPLRAVHRAAKFEQDAGCARWLGRYTSRRLPRAVNIVEPGTLIVGVPSHPARLRDRGLDVVGEMTRSLATSWSIGVAGNSLKRSVLGRPQNHLDRERRQINVRKAFSTTTSGRALHPTHMILFDDVVTTGATLDACASLLEEKGHRITLMAMAFRRELFDRR